MIKMGDLLRVLRTKFGSSSGRIYNVTREQIRKIEDEKREIK